MNDLLRLSDIRDKMYNTEIRKLMYGRTIFNCLNPDLLIVDKKHKPGGSGPLGEQYGEFWVGELNFWLGEPDELANVISNLANAYNNFAKFI